MAPLHPAEVLNVRAVLLSAPSGAAADTGQCGMPERERAAGAGRPCRCSASSWQACRRGNGTRAGGSGGIPWLDVVPPVGARFARFIKRPQTPRNPDQAGAGGARKAAALHCFFLSFAPLPPSPSPPATKPALQLKGACAPPPWGD